MGIFSGKKGIVMGVANNYSIASYISEKLHKEGASLGFSHLPDANGQNKMEKRVRKVVDSMDPFMVEPCDVAKDEDVSEFFSKVEKKVGKIDFLVHSIAFAPIDDIRCRTIDSSRSGFSLAMDISVYSLIAVAKAAEGIFNPGGSVVAMTYYGGEKVVPGYNLMGLCKSALDSAVRYLAVDLGKSDIRVNAVSAGAIKTLASSAVGDFSKMLKVNPSIAPLGKNVTAEEVGGASCFLLSDWASGITGEVLHVDAGYNVMGGISKELLADLNL